MKIGIITIHKSPNYGGSLQAFALYYYIKQQGYNCELIDLYRPAICGYKASRNFPRLIPSEKSKYVFLKKMIKKIFLEIQRLIDVILYNEDRNNLKNEKFNQFFSEIKYSKAYHSIDELYKDSLDYDILISGSDQVWNPTMRYSIEPYFLTFAKKGVKKISYSSSIGLNQLPEKLSETYKNWLSTYDFISVRENKAKQIINGVLPNKDVDVVCDPTLLLSSEYWLSRAVFPEQKGYLLCFALSYNEPLYEYAHKVAFIMGLKLVVFSHGKEKEGKHIHTVVRDAGPLEWIGWIRNAKFVITDSFHASIFSIHCETSFRVYIAPHNTRGSRITELLDRAGCRVALITSLEDPSTMVELNFQAIKNKLNSFIIESQLYLSRVLKL